MAQLDPLLNALVERQAQELVLVDGDRPAFRLGQSLRSVSPKALNKAQIAALLAELSSELDAKQIASGQAPSFSYACAGRQFRCHVSLEGGFRASLSLEGAPGAEQQWVEPAIATANPSGPEIDRYLRKMFELGASDLHLSSGETPMVRKDGQILRLDGEPAMAADDAMRLFEAIMPETNREQFHECHDTDFAHEIPGVARFRANIFADRHGPGGVFRTIPVKILTAEQLGLPPAILKMCGLHKGLVLVTGPTGSGKSTTLAAMIDHINRSRSDHIITIEDPIEFVHSNIKCLINQREVGTHTRGFKTALRAALREDPDIVLVGEMRDLETISIATETAETGHLVFGTLHTSTACSTVERIIDQFPTSQQAQIRTMLSESLKGVVAQNLLKKIGGGRVAALEILVVTPAISNLIREGKTFQIPSLMQTGKNLGMVTLNDALFDLVKNKVVEPEEAYSKALDKSSLAKMLQRAGVRIEVEQS